MTFKLGVKPRSIGLIIFLNYLGVHPELGRDFYGSREDYEVCLVFQYKMYPIEDEI
jgi:hypothetical protein